MVGAAGRQLHCAWPGACTEAIRVGRWGGHSYQWHCRDPLMHTPFAHPLGMLCQQPGSWAVHSPEAQRSQLGSCPGLHRPEHGLTHVASCCSKTKFCYRGFLSSKGFCPSSKLIWEVSSRWEFFAGLFFHSSYHLTCCSPEPGAPGQPALPAVSGQEQPLRKVGHSDGTHLKHTDIFCWVSWTNTED